MRRGQRPDGEAAKPPGGADTDIAHAAVQSLRWHSELPEGRLRLKVENSWVTIEGEVDWHYQKEAAERVIRSLTGVRGMTSLITLRPKRFVADIQDAVRSALQRQAELDAEHVTVDFTGSRVTLSGIVQSMGERRAAELAVWSVPGVTHVDDELAIMTLQPLLM